MCVFPRCCRQCRLFFRVVDHSKEKIFCVVAYNVVSVVGNNAKKSTNSKPYANLPKGFNQGPRLMCFMKESWGEKSRGTVPLTSDTKTLFNPNQKTSPATLQPLPTDPTCWSSTPTNYYNILGWLSTSWAYSATVITFKQFLPPDLSSFIHLFLCR